MIFIGHLKSSAITTIDRSYIYIVSQKTVHLFVSELRQIFTNFIKFRSVDGKMAEIICYIYIFHLT